MTGRPWRLRLKLIEKDGEELVEQRQMLVILDQGGVQADAKGFPILDAQAVDRVEGVGAFRQADPHARRP